MTAANDFTNWADAVTEHQRVLLADAQTSGGLLIAVEAASAGALIAALNSRETPAAVVIGEVTASDGKDRIHVHSR